MSLFNFFQYSNLHQLNLDWILETITSLPKTVNNTYPDEHGNINLPSVASMSSWNGIGADGAGNVDPVEFDIDPDDPPAGMHFYYDSGVLCVTFNDNTGSKAEIAFPVNNGIRYLSYNGSWSDWQFFSNEFQDVSSNITLGVPSCIDQVQPHNLKAVIKNGVAYIYVEGYTLRPAGLNDFIAGGLPVPNDPGTGLGYITGMIQTAQPVELKPCRFLVDGDGDLMFSHLGNAANAGDVLVIRGEYPVA